MKISLYATFIAICIINAKAQDNTLPIDTLFSIKWGTGQEFGRDFFPKNIFGLPDTSARETIPSVDPNQVVSLGENGEIIVGWKNSIIVDGEGNDFYIFENCFLWGDDKLFTEPGIVSVSKDGIIFKSFPFDPLTLKGLAGTRPTYGSGNITNGDFGGDGFDLSTIGMDSIRFVKIKDTTTLVKSDTKHPFYNPIATGFDLDAIVGVHFKDLGTINSVEDFSKGDLTVEIKGNTIYMSKKATKSVNLKFYNINGCLIKSYTADSNDTFVRISPQISRGLYYVIVESDTISAFTYIVYQ